MRYGIPPLQCIHSLTHLHDAAQEMIRLMCVSGATTRDGLFKNICLCSTQDSIPPPSALEAAFKVLQEERLIVRRAYGPAGYRSGFFGPEGQAKAADDAPFVLGDAGDAVESSEKRGAPPSKKARTGPGSSTGGGSGSKSPGLQSLWVVNHVQFVRLLRIEWVQA